MKKQIKDALLDRSNPEKADFFPRFFKTGKGEYGEGDKFFGVTVPNCRAVAKQHRDASLKSIASLLDDSIHECRLTALFIMVLQYDRGSDELRDQLIALYFEKMDRVNNWDLVDASAEKLLGRHLADQPRKILDELASEDHLWKQRISMIACLYFIKHDDFRDTKRIAKKLLNHPHDLIHKAVGWMLREMGKRDEAELTTFLNKHYKKMPRTMLRYAIERFDEETRQAYLSGNA